MNLYDYILIALLLFAIAAALVSIHRQHTSGGCCGSCEGCTQKCEKAVSRDE